MRNHLIVAAATLSASIFGTAAFAAEYTSIIIERPVNASADDTWKKIGPFCSLTEWLGPPCEITKGNGGDIGSIRSIFAGRVTEILVAKTRYSYTYTFPAPNPTAYHGTLGVVPDGAQKSKIVYTLFYDEEPNGTAEAKAADRDRRTKTFTGGVEKMVQIVEGKKP